MPSSAGKKKSDAPGGGASAVRDRRWKHSDESTHKVPTRNSCVLTSYLIVHLLGPSRVFFFNDTATTENYTLSLHDALPILHVMTIIEMKTKTKTNIIMNIMNQYYMK